MKKYIVIEGIHGSGKTSVAKALAEKLCDESFSAEYYHFPQETDQLGQVIRETLTDTDLVKKWEVLGLLYIAFSNRFHVKTQQDSKYYVQDRDSVTTGLVFQSAIPWEMRLELYKYAIKNLKENGVVVYVKADKEVSLKRLQVRNANLFSQSEVWKNKSKDKFIEEDFHSLSDRYEKEMLPGLEKM